MNNEVISVIDVANNFGKNRAYIFKILGRFGIETVKEKSSEARGQKIELGSMWIVVGNLEGEAAISNASYRNCMRLCLTWNYSIMKYRV